MRVPERRPDPRRGESPAAETKQRQRIRIRPKPTSPSPAPAITRARTPEPVRTVTTTRRPPPASDNEVKQTFGQSLSGIFDPSQLTVFGDTRLTPAREEPRVQIAQPQFRTGLNILIKIQKFFYLSS